MEQVLTPKKMINIFGSEITLRGLIHADNSGRIPKALRIGKNQRRAWKYSDIPEIGEKYGFLKPLEKPVVVTIYSMKGGTYKTTYAVNLARIAALHNVKTVVIGIDMQCDASNELGMAADLTQSDTLQEALKKLEGFYGLFDFHRNKIDLDELPEDTDIPTLSYIPETPELAQLEREIGGMNFRETWLRTKVIDPLIELHSPQLIILDCAPSWNNLTTNAIMASDLLLSPVECKIKQFRNFPFFYSQVNEFLKQTGKNLKHTFATTKLHNSILSNDIRNWYLKNLEHCLPTTVRDSAKVEEASASLISVIEHVPTHPVATEMRNLITEIWSDIHQISELKSEIGH